jgi:acetyl esterase/lipase
VLLAGCGGDGAGTPASTSATTAAAPVRFKVGQGVRAAYVFRPAGAAPDARLPTVVFLHGWTATDPEAYGPWVRHLVAGGRQVILPVYQSGLLTKPEEAFGNAIAGLRAALKRAPTQTSDVVAAGHSAGGALAADLAATAEELGLPVPRAVFAAYPGRMIIGIPFTLPERGDAAIPAGTRVLALAGDDDRTVGTRWARRIARSAVDGEFRLVTDGRVDDHLGPQRADAASRATFWAPLDRLLSER